MSNLNFTRLLIGSNFQPNQVAIPVFKGMISGFQSVIPGFEGAIPGFQGTIPGF